MDTKQLAALVAVVDRASFSLAAEQLGVTQPAVSLAIRSLERRLGCTLIDRTARRAEPTDCGRVVYEAAQRILGVEEELLLRLDEEREGVAGPLVIGASTGPGERILPQLLGAFRAEHPDVSVALRVDDTESIIARVLERELEIGIVGAERPHRQLVFEPFLRDDVILVVPPGHRLAGRTVPLAEVIAEPLVLQQEGAGVRAVLERALRARGVRARDLRIAGELGLQESAKSAVEHGLGVTFISRLAVERELAEGRLATARVEGLDLDRVFYLVRLAARTPSRAVREFLAFAHVALGGLAAAPAEAVAPAPAGGLEAAAAGADTSA